MAKAVVVDVVAVREAEMHDFRHGVHYRIKHPVIICSFGIIRRINTGFGRSTTNFVTKANFRPLCLKWDFLGLFMDLSGPLSYLHQNAAKLTRKFGTCKQNRDFLGSNWYFGPMSQIRDLIGMPG